ncbi:MAG: DUF4271 domain-containing protein [Schleiferiaceae bacterium]|jgi:hypothetical protein|nr:DUF4271 domain-containing protein [Schleiferiaceae bacterium]
MLANFNIASDTIIKTYKEQIDSSRSNMADTILSEPISTNSDSLVSQEIIEIKPIGEEGNALSSQRSDWMVGVLLVSLILMAIIRFSFSKYLHRVIDAIVNAQTSNSLFVEKNMRNLRGAIFMNCLFFVNGALFLSQYSSELMSLKHANNSFSFFLYCLLALLLIYLGKLIVIRTFGYIFNGTKESKEYMHTVFLYNKNLGMFLLPITLSVPFIAYHAVPYLLNAGLIMALVFFLFRIARGLKILFRKHVSIFYMILYLCALEILPLLMIYKLLKSLA